MVKSIVTFSDIILYWDIMDCKSLDEKFYVFLDGELVATTDKTHIEIRNIENKNPSVEIYTDEGKENLFYRESFTLPEKPKFIDITTPPYSAVGDGKTLNTSAIQKAIDDCKDGECVYVPKGIFLTGALTLHSNMFLYIEEEGVLQGSANREDYLPKVWSRFEGKEMECYTSFINMGNIKNRDEYCCENVMIFGGGKICGGGKALADNVVEYELPFLEIDPDNDQEHTHLAGRLRPKLINISCTKNVVIDNIGIETGSCWNVHMLYSDNVVTCNCRFFSYGVGNGDGWDPDSSTNCTLFNCDFNTGDDCVAIKSGKNPEGNEINKPCKEIRVFDCRCAYGHGGIAIGSEISGGIDGVYVWDCELVNTVFGIEIKGTKKRGAYVKNVYVAKCSVPRVMFHSVWYNDDGIGAPTVPQFSDCKFERLHIKGEALIHRTTTFVPCPAIELMGFDDDHLIENVSFDNIVIDNGRDTANQSISLQMVKNISISNISVR